MLKMATIIVIFVLFILLGAVVLRELGAQKFDRVEPGDHVLVKDEENDYHREVVIEKAIDNSYIVTDRGNRYTTLDILTGKISV